MLRTRDATLRGLLLCAALPSCAKQAEPVARPEPVVTAAVAPAAKAPGALDVWERARPRASVRLAVRDPLQMIAALDHLSDLFGAAPGEADPRSDLQERARALAKTLGIPDSLVDGVDGHGEFRASWAFPWSPPLRPEDGAPIFHPGSHARAFIPSQDARSLLETTAAVNLMRDDGELWTPTPSSPAALYLRAADGGVEVATSPESLTEREPAVALPPGGLRLEVNDASEAAHELADLFGVSQADEDFPARLATVRRLERLEAAAALAPGQDATVALTLHGSFLDLEELELLGLASAKPSVLERRLPPAPVGVALVRWAEGRQLIDALLELAPVEDAETTLGRELTGLTRDLAALTGLVDDAAAAGVWAFDAGDHAFVLAADVIDPARARQRATAILDRVRDLSSKYGRFFHAVTDAPGEALLTAKRDVLKHGALKAGHVIVTLPPSLVPEREGATLLYGPRPAFEFAAFEHRGVVYLVSGPGTRAFVREVAALDRPKAPSLGDSDDARALRELLGGCQVCVLADGAAMTRSLIGRAAAGVTPERLRDAAALLPRLGLRGGGGWALRVDPDAIRIAGRWPASASQVPAESREAWARFLQLLGKRRERLSSPFTELFG
ncbi:MAG: hypothetical protein KC636_20275 [Myxococcales bacterium]|nr:hypothetical protein [Myxococcales bacterium]